MKQKPILSEATINAGEKLSPESRKKVETAVASMLALELKARSSKATPPKN